MEEFDPREMGARLRALALFRPLLDGAVLKNLLALLDGEDAARRADAYCAFVAALYGEGGDLGRYVLRSVLESENAVVCLRAAGQREPAEMAAALARELALFSRLAATPPRQLAAAAGGADFLPAYASTPCDCEAEYARLLREIGKRGYGIFAAYTMFTLDGDGRLAPVKNPDPQRLVELVGYERERAAVLQNTRALLRGLPACNILLYGDAGTGKSSTVKAIGNEYAQDGLRLVEIRKNQLYRIPALMDALAQNPLKFIFFIDDLSFPADDNDFTALKAILEGNISARPANIVVYATSNRRHMVAERFAERLGEEVHINDALEEQTSLSARFGLTITFLKPDRALYTGIVQGLARQMGVDLPQEELQAKAEAHALRYGGRSPRTARQFAELMKAEQTLQSQGE